MIVLKSRALIERRGTIKRLKRMRYAFLHNVGDNVDGATTWSSGSSSSSSSSLSSSTSSASDTAPAEVDAPFERAHVVTALGRFLMEVQVSYM